VANTLADMDVCLTFSGDFQKHLQHLRNFLSAALSAANLVQYALSLAVDLALAGGGSETDRETMTRLWLARWPPRLQWSLYWSRPQ